MKKSISILLITCLLISTLSGCSVIPSAVNKAKLIGEWQIEDIQTKAEESPLSSIVYNMSDIFICFDKSDKAEITVEFSENIINAGLKQTFRYSVSGNILLLEGDEEIGSTTANSYQYEISFEDGKMILTNDIGDKLVLSRINRNSK